MTTLSRANTDLLYSQRAFTNESKTSGATEGDWFYSFWAYGFITTNAFNNLIDQYNGWEDDADNSNLQGTDPSGGHFSIASLPSRPRPIHK